MELVAGPLDIAATALLGTGVVDSIGQAAPSTAAEGTTHTVALAGRPRQQVRVGHCWKPSNFSSKPTFA